MKKQYCDFCGGGMDFELGKGIEIYDHSKGEAILEKDFCDGCKVKIMDFLKNLEKN